MGAPGLREVEARRRAAAGSAPNEDPSGVSIRQRGGAKAETEPAASPVLEFIRSLTPQDHDHRGALRSGPATKRLRVEGGKRKRQLPMRCPRSGLEAAGAKGLGAVISEQ
jgi:hypothetical protein